jgi:hypothetical protein
VRRLRRCVVQVLIADIDCQIRLQNVVKRTVGSGAGNQLQGRGIQRSLFLARQPRVQLKVITVRFRMTKVRKFTGVGLLLLFGELGPKNYDFPRYYVNVALKKSQFTK